MADRQKMIIHYPYTCVIATKKQAYEHIMHMCMNCGKYDCSGARATKCNEVKKQIRNFAKKL